MHMAIDQSRKQRKPAPIDAGGAAWNRDGATGTGGMNALLVHDDCSPLDRVAIAVDEPDIVNRDDHGISFRSGT